MKMLLCGFRPGQSLRSVDRDRGFLGERSWAGPFGRWAGNGAGTASEAYGSPSVSRLEQRPQTLNMLIQADCRFDAVDSLDGSDL
jgi:hypothetical protein